MFLDDTGTAGGKQGVWQPPATLTVDLTEADIKAGRRHDPDRCAIAVALRRELPEGLRARVTYIEVLIMKQRGRRTLYRFWMSNEGRQWLWRFDDGRTKPGPTKLVLSQ